ncbi:hypothetical protein NQ315_001136 [Exocentrus adspersus]|uniref:Small ribosomal subunit protein mS31 n=1 Tax=Exocentrus adspersus TaxID=1586481 RepID=A0AAV8WGU9_9CUCU|nr:hypothetical protein NQ315_001136 [Exocentrus adspersus]
MNALCLFSRVCPGRIKLLYPAPAACVKDMFYYEKSTSSTTSKSNQIEVSKAKANRDEAVNKLNNLLQSIIENKDIGQTKTKIELAQPTNKRLQGKVNKEGVKVESIEKQMVNAVKEVAQDIGGDVKQTESELLSKLLSPSDSAAPTSTNLNEIVKGLKIDRESKPAEQSRADQVRNILQKVRTQSAGRVQDREWPRRITRHKQKPEMVVQKIDLFGGEALGIFTNKELKDSVESQTWESLYQRDLRLAVTHPPANYFQQMILWTQQGKIWKARRGEEGGLHRTHIFRRAFRALVPSERTAKAFHGKLKKEHIEWYKNYFEEKRNLLQEVGAFPAQKETQKTIE